jgi:hypothetical protein
LRKTLAQQSCLQLKGPVRRYRPDAEAPDAPLRIAVLSIGQRHSLRVGPGEFFFALVNVSLAWSQAADQYPDLSNGVRAAASSTYTIPTLNHHITLGVTLPSPITTPVNGLGALISLIFGVNGPSRGGGCA